ncbi:MAG: CRISPR-associated endonuclease Cas1 [Verrucomicrobiales bacterium]
MPTACVTSSASRIHLVSERLEITRPGQEGDPEPDRPVRREVPLRDLDRLIVSEGASLSGAALAELLRRGIPVSLLGWNGHFLGDFQPVTPAHGAWRLRQYRSNLDGSFGLWIAGKLVAAKIYNQRRCLQRFAANRKLDVAPTLEHLGALLSDTYRSETLDTLRGYEGAAAARYFRQWADFLPADFPFERRTTRPPLNAVNACLSFGSTLLYHEAVSAVHARGLDPALGFLHVTEDGRWSLALDLIEPFRPVLIEALALDLFSHQILEEKHFHPREGGIYLNDEGRARFIVQYERRMERQFMSEFAGHRTTLRQQLEDSVLALKRALEQPEGFEAFLMN